MKIEQIRVTRKAARPGDREFRTSFICLPLATLCLGANAAIDNFARAGNHSLRDGRCVARLEELAVAPQITAVRDFFLFQGVRGGNPYFLPTSATK